jgi:hypothetical protein
MSSKGLNRQYCPQTRWSLLGMQYISRHKISRWMTSCYYPSRKNLQVALAYYTLTEMLHVFSLSAAIEQSVPHTNGSLVIPPTASSPPYCARRAHTPQRSSHGLCPVVVAARCCVRALPCSTLPNPPSPFPIQNQTLQLFIYIQQPWRGCAV